MHLQWRELVGWLPYLKASEGWLYLRPPVVGKPFSRTRLSFLRLQCGYETGEDRLYLRLPVEVTHKITDGESFAGSGWRMSSTCWWVAGVVLRDHGLSSRLVDGAHKVTDGEPPSLALSRIFHPCARWLKLACATRCHAICHMCAFLPKCRRVAHCQLAEARRHDGGCGFGNRGGGEWRFERRV